MKAGSWKSHSDVSLPVTDKGVCLPSYSLLIVFFLLNAGNAYTVWSSRFISGTLSQKDKQILFFFSQVSSVNIDVVLRGEENSFRQDLAR